MSSSFPCVSFQLLPSSGGVCGFLPRKLPRCRSFAAVRTQHFQSVDSVRCKCLSPIQNYKMSILVIIWSKKHSQSVYWISPTEDRGEMFFSVPV